VPLGQLVHLLARAPENVPDLQLVHAASPLLEYVPAGHSLQTVLPATSLKEPAEHAEHAVALAAGAILPAAQPEHDAAPLVEAN